MDFILAVSSNKEPTPKVEIPVSPPNFDEDKIKAEYSKVWVEQSKLLWGRLQTAYFLHVGVFGGWFGLHANGYKPFIQVVTLSLGPILSIFICLIIWRDGAFMDKIKACAGNCLKNEDLDNKRGRWFAIWIIILLSLFEILLGIILFYKPDLIR